MLQRTLSWNLYHNTVLSFGTFYATVSGNYVIAAVQFWPLGAAVEYKLVEYSNSSISVNLVSINLQAPFFKSLKCINYAE